MIFFTISVLLLIAFVIFHYSSSNTTKDSKETFTWDKGKFQEKISKREELKRDASNSKTFETSQKNKNPNFNSSCTDTKSRTRKVNNEYRVSKLLILKAHYIGRKFLNNPNREFAEEMCLHAISSLEKKQQTPENKLRKLFYTLILAEAERDFGKFKYRADAKSYSENNNLTHIFSDYLKIIDATQTHKHVEGFSTNGYITDEGIKTKVNETVQIGFDIINISYDAAQRSIGFENLSYAEEEFLYHKTLTEIMSHHEISIPRLREQYT